MSVLRQGDQIEIQTTKYRYLGTFQCVDDEQNIVIIGTVGGDIGTTILIPKRLVQDIKVVEPVSDLQTRYNEYWEKG